MPQYYTEEAGEGTKTTTAAATQACTRIVLLLVANRTCILYVPDDGLVLHTHVTTTHSAI